MLWRNLRSNTVPPDTAQNALNRSGLQSGALPSELKLLILIRLVDVDVIKLKYIPEF